jgi:hypothetical protein
MDPAPRSGNTWKGVFEKIGSKCVGRGTKGFPIKFEFDKAGEDRIIRLHREYQRQLDDVYKMEGNITTTANNKSVNMNAEKQSKKINNNRNLGNAAGNKRTRNNNVNTNKTIVKRRPFVKAIKPVARTMNANNRKSVGIKRTRNNNNKTVKKPKIIQPELRTAAMGAARRMNVINLTKNNNNNRSLTQLAEQNTRYYQQIQDVKKRLRRPHLVKNPAKFPGTIAQLKRELKRLRILRQEGRDRLASLKKRSKL